jgi:hypothetical protein
VVDSCIQLIAGKCFGRVVVCFGKELAEKNMYLRNDMRCGSEKGAKIGKSEMRVQVKDMIAAIGEALFQHARDPPQ